MDRPYGTYSSTSTTTRNAGATRTRGRYGDVETHYPDDDVQDYDAYDDSPRAARAGYGSTASRGYGDTGYGDGRYGGEDDYADYGNDDYGDHGDYDDVYEYEDPIDRRWIWVAGVAGAILLVAVICTVVILGGGDSGAVSKTVTPPTPATTHSATASAAPPVQPSVAPPALTSVAPPPPPAPLSPETVTTVAPSPTASAVPTPAPAAPPAAVAPVSPRTITYTVTGTRPLLDMVTVVYTDAQGALQTEFNVALPWTRSVTLDPGVDLKSVIATSLTGQLNCAVTDSSGTPLVVQNNNSMIATCTR
ncbi:hypothetical protein MMAD_15340 [Mycolicibacterium madagascariense]|uniref:Transport accessory protein MmpS3 n=1 Tax=Mycolicibacterium madagascariense TaxID=212765 RepID=A0A7I7XBU5_9MYCO|nr:hypothetical protein [Mycolicibacterium madagascariense]MCV7014447.1 hypothetical protein [Mycolicibacterium madagascariense]BBZ27239.1 hypothetical protein MMAD_15340 [Mycolicibacterium madagascariense]